MTAIDFTKRNTALEINPIRSAIDIHITDHGSSWLWTVFSLFAFFAVAHIFAYGFTSSHKKGLKKTLLVVPLCIYSILAVAYFTMASNLGYTGTPTEFSHVTTSEDIGVRQIFYAKYIAYFLSWPWLMMIIEVTTHDAEFFNEGDFFGRLIALFQGLFTKILATSVFVLGLLIGSLIESTYKWGYFTFAVAALLFAEVYIFINSFNAWRLTTSRTGILVVYFDLLVWILYPIAWGLSEGGNKIQPDSEAVFYGILDLITFLVVPLALTWINFYHVDNEYFSKVWIFNVRRSQADPEKEIGETPRHSGDTAVAPVGVPTDEQVV
ncbi:plasma membrane heat shock protein [Scheffersomyces xylosifermentans]|uniref:plasma membrane heat shock protein n=1 Tax=Scheffersomyces xylosifermentans TaxID=1304137 RepID=UPI00315D9456